VERFALVAQIERAATYGWRWWIVHVHDFITKDRVGLIIPRYVGGVRHTCPKGPVETSTPGVMKFSG